MVNSSNVRVSSISEVEKLLKYELECYLNELREYGKVGEDGVIRWDDELVGFESREEVINDFVGVIKS